LRHPSSEVLEKLLRGDLSGRRLETVLAHLKQGCRRCEEELEPLVSFLVIDGRLQQRVHPEEDYDAPLKAAFAAVLARSRDLAAERAAAPRLAQALCESLVAEGGDLTDLPPDLQQRVATASICEELLRRSTELRFDDPEGMVQTARLAVAIADRLDPVRYGSASLADLRARAWAELGNALRVRDDLRGADRALTQATQLLRRGSGQPSLTARVEELTAALRAHQRRFREAFQHLKKAQDLYEREKDRTAVGRILIIRGLYSGYDGDTQGAMQYLKQALQYLHPHRDSKLRFLAIHNLILFMAERGEYREARVALFTAMPLYHEHAGKMDWLRVRGLEGTIAAGLGDLEKAERAFRTERKASRRPALFSPPPSRIWSWSQSGSARAARRRSRRLGGRSLGWWTCSAGSASSARHSAPFSCFPRPRCARASPSSWSRPPCASCGRSTAQRRGGDRDDPVRPGAVMNEGCETQTAVISYPADLPQLLELSDNELARELLFLAAAKLFELGRLSSGKAAHLAGISRVAFLRDLARIGVAAINLRDDEIDAEIQAARELAG
jgi:tetratricopeptide (TPR) repeat protein/predicted HTH domain antitoxin